MEILSTIMAVLIFALVFTLSKTIEYYRNENIRQKIESCFCDRFRDFQYHSEKDFAIKAKRNAEKFFYNYFSAAQGKVATECRVSNDELDQAIEIVKMFQQWLINSYLLGHYNYMRFAKVHTEIFLVERLSEFLAANCFDSDVYYKMYYVALHYKECSHPWKDGTISHYESDGIKTIILSKKGE